MGIASIIEEVRSPAMTPGPAPHRAGVLFLDEQGQPMNPKTKAPPAEPAAETAPDEVIVQGSRATRVFDTPQPEEEAEPEVAAAEHDDGGNDVDKVRLHAQRKISEQGAELAALRQQVNAMINATKSAPVETHPALSPPDMAQLQQEIDAIGQNFLDDIPGNIKKLTALSAKAAQASVMPIVRQNEQKAALEATKQLVKQYPGLVTNKAEAAYVDAYASQAAMDDGHTDEPTIEHYQQAMDAYAKKVGWTKPTKGAVVNPEVDRMKQEASRTAPAGATVTSKGKVWRQSELDALLTRHPDKYRALQPEIMRAYREHRVK